MLSSSLSVEPLPERIISEATTTTDSAEACLEHCRWWQYDQICNLWSFQYETSTCNLFHDDVLDSWVDVAGEFGRCDPPGRRRLSAFEAWNVWFEVSIAKDSGMETQVINELSQLASDGILQYAIELAITGSEYLGFFVDGNAYDKVETNAPSGNPTPKPTLNPTYPEMFEVSIFSSFFRLQFFKFNVNSMVKSER